MLSYLVQKTFTVMTAQRARFVPRAAGRSAALTTKYLCLSRGGVQKTSSWSMTAEHDHGAWAGDAPPSGDEVALAAPRERGQSASGIPTPMSHA
jgi:hypothetical protein